MIFFNSAKGGFFFKLIKLLFFFLGIFCDGEITMLKNKMITRKKKN